MPSSAKWRARLARAMVGDSLQAGSLQASSLVLVAKPTKCMFVNTTLVIIMLRQVVFVLVDGTGGFLDDLEDLLNELLFDNVPMKNVSMS